MPADGTAELLVDDAARRRIQDDLDATLFVEAGAGSGKTTALVDRVVALVTTGTVELSAVAAITFTEKAGLELRERLRRRLQEAATGPDEPVATRCAVALGQLDGAAIGTLHAFARRILSEHPVEAGLPPRIEVLDEVASGVAFERRWSAFREQLLAEPSLERLLLLLFATGVDAKALDALALAFEGQWDLVAERIPPLARPGAEPSDLPPIAEQVAPMLEAIEAVCAERADCRDQSDKLCAHLGRVARYVTELRSLDDEYALLEALTGATGEKPPSFSAYLGRQGAWSDVGGVRRRLQAAGGPLEALTERVKQHCAIRIGSAIRAFTLGAAEERRAAGQLEFHDLLVMARALLRDPHLGSTVRASLSRRYQRILLDELQDTDPIQMELAVRIAADDPEEAAAGTAPWDEVAVRPGRLFMVGDPKQSIYRFRRADLATFLVARDRFGPGGEAATEGLVELTTNFRTGPRLVGWLNAVFARLLTEAPATAVAPVSQPGFVALSPHRHDAPGGHPVAIVGRHAHPTDAGADDVRAAEAADVAAAVARIVDEGWPVGDDGAPGGWRPAGLADVAVLVPARTSLPFLLDAFDALGIAARAESSSLVYATRAVRDLLMVLRAVDDPGNSSHVLAALRTPLLGCGDDDLFRFRVERHGRWNPVARQPDTVAENDPVREAMAYLRSLVDLRHWLSPSELLDRVVRDRRALELGFAEGRPRDTWRRLRFVVDQARAWSDATGGSLRQYLHWVGCQTADGAWVAEAVLPETDDDAVRILTIHAAKGLEFPITIVSGLSTVPGGWPRPAEVVFPPGGGVGYRFGKRVETEEYRALRPVDEQMGLDERIRLLYVACTRARDHLVVSLHRRQRASAPAPAKRTNAELLLDGMGEHLDALPDAVEPGGRRPTSPPSLPTAPPPPPFEVWAGEHEAALSRASQPTTVAATALTDEGTADPAADDDPADDFRDDLAAGLRKRPRDLDLPPWRKGRYGSAVGRAVHGVLQTVDLATGAGTGAAVAAQCAAEAVGDAALVARLVDLALSSPSVRAAAAGAHWRELYACTPVGGRLLEGYVDLLYRRADGLVVVDYKTAATDDPAELERRVECYRLQGASYALAVAAATGEAVTEVVFVFLTPSGVVERSLDDLAATIERVRSLVEAGGEVVVEDRADTT